MYKLVTFLILFTSFLAMFFFNYLHVMPYLTFSERMNVYQHILNLYADRQNNDCLSGFVVKTDPNNTGYLLDYSGAYMITKLHFLIPDNPLKIYIPILILRTGDNLTDVINSGDNLFSGITWSNIVSLSVQEISGGNDFIYLGYNVDTGVEAKKLFLNYLYIYCILGNYYYRRYINRNKKESKKDETDTGRYLCKSDKTSSTCSCDLAENEVNYDLSPYEYICANTNSGTCNTDGCINFITGTINLNDTNCSFNNLVNNTTDFQIR